MNQPVVVPEVLSADLPAGVFLLDVREDDEWTAGHAPDAVHVRLRELGARAGGCPPPGCHSARTGGAAGAAPTSSPAPAAASSLAPAAPG